MAMKSEVRFANQFLKSFETSPNVTYLRGYIKILMYPHEPYNNLGRGPKYFEVSIRLCPVGARIKALDQLVFTAT